MILTSSTDNGSDATANDLLVEIPHIEAFAEPLLGTTTQLQNLELPNLVGERLAGTRDVSVDFGSDVGFAECSVRSEILARLLPAPAFRMQARIDDKGRRTRQLRVQCAELAVRIGIEPEFAAERFCVQRPSRDKRSIFAEATEPRQVGRLLRECCLEVTPRDSLIQVRRVDRIGRARCEFVVLT